MPGRQGRLLSGDVLRGLSQLLLGGRQGSHIHTAYHVAKGLMEAECPGPLREVLRLQSLRVVGGTSLGPTRGSGDMQGTALWGQGGLATRTCCRDSSLGKTPSMSSSSLEG